MLDQQVPGSFLRRHPMVSVAALLMVSLWLWNGAYGVVTIAAIVGVLITVNRRRRYLARRDSGLRARADYENRLALAGDSRGVFGRYPPVQQGWFPDPQNRWQLRYFDGAMWTGYAIRR